MKKTKYLAGIFFAAFLLAWFMTGCSINENYSGHYEDTQGTADVYSELKLELSEDGSYQTEIALHRLTTLTGTAIPENNQLVFEDTTVKVKGTIHFSDGKAVFTVTESEFEYLSPRESFAFVKSE